MTTETRELITVSQPLDDQVATYEDPDEIVARATKQANALMKIVKAKNLARKFGDKEYLEAPAWQVIAAFNSAHPVPRPIERILDKDGSIIGYLATVDLLTKGNVVASGQMTCYLTEYPCQGKKGDDKHRAAISAAQTWALSKAAKMKFAWVAVLAGYEPTPAEELSDDQTKQAPDNPYWCREHKTIWFKKGKMTSFGHPVEGATEWCHMPHQPKPPAPPSSDDQLAQGDDRPFVDESDADEQPETKSPATPPSMKSTPAPATTSAKEEFISLIPYATTLGVSQPAIKANDYASALERFKAAIAAKEKAQ